MNAMNGRGFIQLKVVPAVDEERNVFGDVNRDRTIQRWCRDCICADDVDRRLPASGAALIWPGVTLVVSVGGCARSSRVHPWRLRHA